MVEKVGTSRERRVKGDGKTGGRISVVNEFLWSYVEIREMGSERTKLR